MHSYLFLFILVFLLGCSDSIPDDSRLTSLFNSNYYFFYNIVKITNKYKKNGNIKNEVINICKCEKTLESLGINEITKTKKGVYFLMYSTGIGVSGFEKGFFYTKKNILNTENNLDKIYQDYLKAEKKDKNYRAFFSIKKNWYLYLWVS